MGQPWLDGRVFAESRGPTLHEPMKFYERCGRGDRSKSYEGSYVTDALDHFSEAQRSKHDTGPEACANRTNLSDRKRLDSNLNAQERALQCIADLRGGGIGMLLILYFPGTEKWHLGRMHSRRYRSFL
jgi:hypothetical protein